MQNLSRPIGRPPLPGEGHEATSVAHATVLGLAPLSSEERGWGEVWANDNHLNGRL